MRFSILGFSQDAVCALNKTIVDKDGKYKTLSIDVADLLIIQELADFMNRKSIIKHTINDKMYFSIKYEAILEDLPILGIKKQALRDRIDKLCEFNIIEKYVERNDAGSWAAFRLGDAYEMLKYRVPIEDGGVCIPLHTGVYSTTHGCVADYTPNNYTTINYNNKEEDTNVSPKKNDYQAIVDCWNEYNGKAWGKVIRLGAKRKRIIKSALDNQGITQEELMRLFKTFPYADSWLFHPTKEHKDWRPDFDWWMRDTNGWLTKALEGKVHNANPQAFNDIMQGGETNATYTPQGRTIWYDENTKSYWTDDNFYYGVISDGYTDDNRPDGATLTMSNARGAITWNSLTKKWDKK